MTIFGPKVSISNGLGFSNSGKTMTRDLRFRPASYWPSFLIQDGWNIGQVLFLCGRVKVYKQAK